MARRGQWPGPVEFQPSVKDMGGVRIRSNPGHTERLTMRRPPTVLLLTTPVAVALFIWIVVGQTPTRNDTLNYVQFMVAGVTTVVLILTLVIACWPVRSRRQVAFRVSAALMAIVSVLAAYELLCYAIAPRQIDDNPSHLSTGKAMEADAKVPFTRPSDFSWTGLSRGDLAIAHRVGDPYARQVTFQTDHEGFRNSKVLTHAEMVFVGDDFTEAGAVPEAETFVQLLGARMGVTVRNLARGGYTAPMELTVVERHALACNPRIVVWQVAEGNDFDDAMAYRRWLAMGRPEYRGRGGASRVPRGVTWRRRSPTYRAYAALRCTRSPQEDSAGTFRDAQGRRHAMRFRHVPNPARPLAEHPLRNDIVKAISQGRDLLEAKGIRLLVVMVPMKFRAMAPSWEFDGAIVAALQDYGLTGPVWDVSEEKTAGAWLAEQFKALGIPFVDATPSLRQAAESGVMVYPPNDSHLSTEGHEVISDLIARNVDGLRTTD